MGRGGFVTVSAGVGLVAMDRILDGSKKRVGLFFQYYIPSTHSLVALFLSQEYSTRRTECLLSFSFCSTSRIFFDNIETKLSGTKFNLQ